MAFSNLLSDDVNILDFLHKKLSIIMKKYLINSKQEEIYYSRNYNFEITENKLKIKEYKYKFKEDIENNL